MHSIPEVEKLRFRWYLRVQLAGLTGTEYMGALSKEGGGIEPWRITLGGLSGIISVLFLLSSSEDVLEGSE